MSTKRLRTAIVGIALGAGLLAGPVGVAAAQHQEAGGTRAGVQEILPCAVLDELESTLRELASSSDPGSVKDRLDVVLETLDELRPGVPVLLRPAYDGFVAQLKSLRVELEKNPSSDVVKQVNATARQLADLVALVPCV